MSEYERGFTDAVKLIAIGLRESARLIADDQFGSVERDGRIFDVVVRSGQKAYARRLEVLAGELEAFLK